MTHACYLLRSLNPRFKKACYIGCTTDPRRRLRQHNGERGQGARLTKAKRPWEMVLCVYGFSSHVDALKFEWAWQHPLESITVREAAAKLPSLRGVPAMITLVCTMVTLPRWNSSSLSLQFMLSSLLQYRHGSPPLPSQMRLFVAPMQSLPGKESGGDDEDDDEDEDNDGDDCDKISTACCPESYAISGSEQLDGERKMTAASISAAQRQVVVSGVTSTAEQDAFKDCTSPCAATSKTEGKKSRKGKTPKGRVGKRGRARKKLSEDPISVDLQSSGFDIKLSFEDEVARRSDIDWNESANGSNLVQDSAMTLEIREEKFARARRPGDCSGSSRTEGVNLTTISIEEETFMCRGTSDKSESASAKETLLFGASSRMAAAATREIVFSLGTGEPQLRGVDPGECLWRETPYNCSGERIYFQGLSQGGKVGDFEERVHSVCGLAARAKEAAPAGRIEGETSVPYEISGDSSSGYFAEKAAVFSEEKRDFQSLKPAAVIECDIVVDETSRMRKEETFEMVADAGGDSCGYGYDEGTRVDVVLEDSKLPLDSSAERTHSFGVSEQQAAGLMVSKCSADGDSILKVATNEPASISYGSHRLVARVGSIDVSNDPSVGIFKSSLSDQVPRPLNKTDASGGGAGDSEITFPMVDSGKGVHSFPADWSYGLRSNDMRGISSGGALSSYQSEKPCDELKIRTKGSLAPRTDNSSSGQEFPKSKQGSNSGDSDIEEISPEEFLPVERRRKGFAQTGIINQSHIQREDGHASSIPALRSVVGLSQTRATGHGSSIEGSVTEIKVHQALLTDVFPIRKQRCPSSSNIHRKARNGEICDILKDRSCNRSASIEVVGTKGQCSDTVHHGWGYDGRCARNVVYDSDEDDIQEISVNEFRQSRTLLRSRSIQNNWKVCSVTAFR